MRAADRIVVALPLSELWNSRGSIGATKQRALGKTEIADMLRSGTAKFVVADCGHPLWWIPHEDCSDFWKREVEPRLVEPDTERINLDNYAGCYCYVASLWLAPEGPPIVLIEKQH